MKLRRIIKHINRKGGLDFVAEHCGNWDTYSFHKFHEGIGFALSDGSSEYELFSSRLHLKLFLQHFMTKHKAVPIM